MISDPEAEVAHFLNTRDVDVERSTADSDVILIPEIRTRHTKPPMISGNVASACMVSWYLKIRYSSIGCCLKIVYDYAYRCLQFLSDSVAFGMACKVWATLCRKHSRDIAY